MKRRSFLVALAGLAGVARSVPSAFAQSMTGMDMGGVNMKGMDGATTAQRLRKLPTGQPLPDLVKLANTSPTPGIFEAVIDAGPAQHEFVKGIKTDVLAYNGAVPGSLVEVSEGDKVKITFRNNVPEQASTIHWHGLETPSDQDGNPTSPVASGAEHVYEFTIPEGSAGSYWYHPHPHRNTAEQAYRGLAGPFIVKAKADPLPAQLGDTTLFISTISLNTDGTIAENTMSDTMNGRLGDHVLVNGAKQPVVTMAPGSSRRFRIYNATSGRFLNLSFEGHTMTLVGTDGGLLAAPVAGLKEILLAPAERVEVVVHFHGKIGAVSLVSKPYERGWMGAGKPAAETLRLMTVHLTGAAVNPIHLPSKLRDIADLGAPVATKKIVMSEAMGMSNDGMTANFLIDNKSFELNRVDLTSKRGEVELWEISNTSDMDHPFHIHGTQFQITERKVGNKITPSAYLSWKDTVNLTRGETVKIKVRQNLLGQRMYHCHILEHEDSGMMGTLNVV